MESLRLGDGLFHRWGRDEPDVLGHGRILVGRGDPEARHFLADAIADAGSAEEITAQVRQLEEQLMKIEAAAAERSEKGE